MTQFIHNDIVKPLHDLPISGKIKKKYTILRILQKKLY